MVEEKKKQLPDNVIGVLASSANSQIGSNKKYITVPLYTDRTSPVNKPNAFITYKLPEGAEVEVTIEIPFKGNVADPNISLDDAMEIMRNANYSIHEAYGNDAKIEKHIVNGNQIKIVGTFTVKR